MNVENVKKLRDHLIRVRDTNRNAFDMGCWLRGDCGYPDLEEMQQAAELAAKGDLNSCGTAGCMAGWACVLAHPNTVYDYSRPIEVDAAAWLGLDQDAACSWFRGTWALGMEGVDPDDDTENRLPDYSTVTVDHAIAFLDGEIAKAEAAA